MKSDKMTRKTKKLLTLFAILSTIGTTKYIKRVTVKSGMSSL